MTHEFRSVLILGGLSDIGRATALAFAGTGAAIQLAGRDLEKLGREADDIVLRGAGAVSVHRFDVLETASFAAFIDGLPVLPDVVVSMIGVLGDQAAAANDAAHASLIMRSNYEGPALILNAFAARFIARGAGTLVGVSSVAGDRGRGSNYTYGSAKAGFTAFLSGLRNRCAKSGVHVVTVKPGFVRTRMTEGRKLPGLITAEPSEVGDSILRAVINRRDVIYSRPVWRVIMAIVRLIPERVFKQLSL